MPKETKIEALRAALVEGERSGVSTPFDFDEFITRKRQGRREPVRRRASPLMPE
jgi:antitoxin ParD1/3/4